MELLRPILELGVVIPGMLLAYFPAKSSLKQPLSKLVLWLVPLLALLCAAGGVVCYARRMPTAPVLAGLTLLAAVIYIKTLRITLWKSGTVASVSYTHLYKSGFKSKTSMVGDGGKCVLGYFCRL